VPDPDGKAYEDMIRRHRALMAQKEAQGSPSTPPAQPRTQIDAAAAGIAHVLNGARVARHEFEKGHTTRAIVDAVGAGADLTWAGLATAGLLKGHVKLRGPFTWRTKPWEPGSGAREWMGEKGIASKGQHAHHALIPNKSWGKWIPDAIKNQPANVKPTEIPLIHTRIHSASRKAGLPRFNALERYWYGTPTWWKAANTSAAGHAIQVAGDHALGHSRAATAAHSGARPPK
jgi:hypothetical protein